MKPYRIAALLLRNWYITSNSVDRWFDIFFWPVFDLVIWGFAAVFVQSVTDNLIIGIFMGGIILWALFDRAQKDVSVYILQDFWDKSVYQLYVTPMKESELFISVALFGVLRALVSAVLLITLASVGYGFHLLDAGAVLLALFILPLFIFGWAVGIVIAGLIFLYGTRIAIITWSLPFLLQPIAAVVYPVSILPKILQTLAFAFPLAHVFEGFRAAMNGVFASSHFWWALVLALVYLAVCYGLFSLCVEHSKKTGFLSKQ